MKTALLAIVAIAVVGTFAWVITRIVKIFVEIEELKEQARNFSDRIDNHCKKVNELNEKVKELELARGIMAENMGVVSEKISGLIETRLKAAATQEKRSEKKRKVQNHETSDR